MEVRVGFLTTLLRLADGLDFYSNRAPEPVFRSHAKAFLKENPELLERLRKSVRQAMGLSRKETAEAEEPPSEEKKGKK